MPIFGQRATGAGARPPRAWDPRDSLISGLRPYYTGLPSDVSRPRTGVKGIDDLIEGGIPEGFLVAVTGEPGCGKTIFSIHFINQGILDGDKYIYITTEESKESIVKQASQFGMDFEKAEIYELLEGAVSWWGEQDILDVMGG